MKDMALEIIPYTPEYANRFRDLNLAWLTAYFHVEEEDRKLLEQSEMNIIDKGGFIFLASLSGQIVGCFALLRIKEGTYELGKMAVDKEYQGRNIGQELLRFAIEQAKVNNWTRIILYSSTKLKSALHIYRKYGFKEVPMEKEVPYTRSDIKMELLFDQ